MSKAGSPKVDYIQLPAKFFVQRYPELCKVPPLCFVVPMLLSDDKYLVRLKDGRIEFGYGEDAWHIQ